MSLTRVLERRGEPVREFFEEHLPDVQLIQQAWKAAGPATIVPIQPVSWGLVGMAFDYRVRYLFTVTPAELLVAAHATITMPELRSLWSGVTEGLAAFLEANSPLRHCISPEKERQLARYCYLLAMYEVIVRAGRAPSNLRDLPQSASIAEQLALAPDGDVADVVALTQAAARAFGPLYGLPMIPNPTFSGSVDVGGADADFIVAGCLIDLKTTTKKYLDREHVYQLVGYALLDYEDALAIHDVGFYASRIPALLTWPLAEVLDSMSSGKETVTTLRIGLRALLRERNWGPRDD